MRGRWAVEGGERTLGFEYGRMRAAADDATGPVVEAADGDVREV